MILDSVWTGSEVRQFYDSGVAAFPLSLGSEVVWEFMDTMAAMDLANLSMTLLTQWVTH